MILKVTSGKKIEVEIKNISLSGYTNIVVETQSGDKYISNEVMPVSNVDRLNNETDMEIKQNILNSMVFEKVNVDGKRKLIVYFSNGYPEDTYVTYEDTMNCLNNRSKKEIHTTIPTVISSQWLCDGNELFIMSNKTGLFEIKLGSENRGTNREIKAGVNILKLLLSGEFGELI